MKATVPSCGKSDGTEAGTVRVKDIRPGTGGSSQSSLTVVGTDALIFGANDGSNGSELWEERRDGGWDGAGSEHRCWDGGSFPISVTAVGSTLYFVANDGATGAKIVKTTALRRETGHPWYQNHSGTAGGSPDYLTAVGSTLYFVANDGRAGSELWKSDGAGRPGRCGLRTSFSGTSGSSPYYLTAVGSTLLRPTMESTG